MPDFGDVNPNTGLPAARYEGQGEIDPLAPSVGNGQISLADWQAYQAKRKKDALLGTLLTLGGMFAAPAASYGGGAAVGAGGAGVGASSPEFGLGAANTGIWSGAGMTPAAYGGAGTAAGIGGGAAGAAGGGFLGMSAKDLAALGLGLGGTIGGALAPKPDMSVNTSTKDPQLQELLAMMMGRMKKAEPLQDSIYAMANGLLPTQYQKGGGGMG